MNVSSLDDTKVESSPARRVTSCDSPPPAASLDVASPAPVKPPQSGSVCIVEEEGRRLDMDEDNTLPALGRRAVSIVQAVSTADDEDDEDYEEDALEDEADDVLSGQRGDKVHHRVDDPSAVSESRSRQMESWFSIGTALTISNLIAVVCLSLIVAGVAVYVNVSYAAAYDRISSRAESCVLNGTSDAFGGDRDGKAVWYGSARSEALLSAFRSSFDAAVLSPHVAAAGRVGDVAVSFFSNRSSGWVDLAHFCSDIAINSALLIEIGAAVYNIAGGWGVRSSVSLGFQLPSTLMQGGSTALVFGVVYSDGAACGAAICRAEVAWFDGLSSETPLARHILNATSGLVTVASDTLCPFCSAAGNGVHTAVWRNEWASSVHLSSAPASGSTSENVLLLINGTMSPSSRFALPLSAHVALSLPTVSQIQDVLVGLGRRDLAVDVTQWSTATGAALKQILQTYTSMFFDGVTSSGLWVRSASNISDVAVSTAQWSTLQRASPMIHSAAPYVSTRLQSLGWISTDTLGVQYVATLLAGDSTTSPLPYVNGSATSAWNYSDIEVAGFFSRTALLADLDAFSSGVRTELDSGQRRLWIATVAVGAVACVLVACYTGATLGVASSITADVEAILQSLSCGKTMELEKATLFVTAEEDEALSIPPEETQQSSPLQSPSHARSAHELRSFNRPSESNTIVGNGNVKDDIARGPNTSPGMMSLPGGVSGGVSAPRPRRVFSSVLEIRAAQEAVNKMIISLKEYRKFLPSTLFVHGELPLHDELAEELLHAIDSPANASPRNQSLHIKNSSNTSLVALPGAATVGLTAGVVTAPPAAQIGGESRGAPGLNEVGGSSSPPTKSMFRVQTLSRPASPSHRGGESGKGTVEFGSMQLPQQGSFSLGPLSPDHALALKRRKGTVLTITFVGFLRISQENIFEAHSVSQTFLQIVLSVIDRNGGVVLSLAPDKVVATWNCFKTDYLHEHHGAQCAHELNRTLHAADEEFLFSDHQIAIAVTTGNVAAGTCGTATERASVVEGRCVELCSDLLTLLVAVNVRCVVTGAVAEHVMAPLWVVPMDVVTDEDATIHEIYELRSGEEPPYMVELRQGWKLFKDRNYVEAKDVFAEVVKQSALRGIDPAALRLLKLSIMFSKLHTPYIRLTPSWQQFETDLPKDAASPDTASPKRRYRSEKRPSYLAEEQLRIELMTMRNASVANAASPQRNGFLDDSHGSPGVPQRTPRSPAPAYPDASPHMQPPLLTSDRRPSLDSRLNLDRRPSLDSRLNLERRPSQERRLSVGGTPVSSRRLTPKGAALEEQISRIGATNQLASALPSLQSSPHQTNQRTYAVEFRDKRDMVFRMSDFVLGKGAVGEVYMGMSETGSLCAIKSVPLPSFAQSAAQGPLNDIQRRRLKRKGINVSSDVDKDVDALLNEVSLLSRLRHENIVGYLSSAIVDKKILVVMEYISGGSLLNLLKEFRGVPLTTARRYLRDILRGLQYLHSEDIVHRDIKPQNVLLLIDGSCKLTDFGTCQRMSRLTGVVTMEGTPQYMAPEATLGKAEKGSDVWSFGILMSQLLTGELPWPNDTNFVAMGFTYRLGHDESMIPVVPDSVLPEARDIILSCCNRSADMRPTVAQLLANPFFSIAAPTPMKGVKKRNERSAQRSPSIHGMPKGVSRIGSPSVAQGPTMGKRLSNALMQFSAFSEPSGPAATEIPDLVVHGPE